MNCGKCGLYHYECVCLSTHLINKKPVPDDNKNDYQKVNWNLLKMEKK